MYIYNLYLLSFILMLYRAPVDTSPVTEGVTLFKHQLLLLTSNTRSLQQTSLALLNLKQTHEYVGKNRLK